VEKIVEKIAETQRIQKILNRRFTQIIADNSFFVCRETTTNKTLSIADNYGPHPFTHPSVRQTRLYSKHSRSVAH